MARLKTQLSAAISSCSRVRRAAIRVAVLASPDRRSRHAGTIVPLRPTMTFSYLDLIGPNQRRGGGGRCATGGGVGRRELGCAGWWGRGTASRIRRPRVHIRARQQRRRRGAHGASPAAGGEPEKMIARGARDLRSLWARTSCQRPDHGCTGDVERTATATTATLTRSPET